ncbi:TPA: transcriptional regulator [Citrobacter braakii]|nr:transcriptional regulator [Citrobacter braakii]HBC8729100.1 transcriptional regulator [Citrobacter braakii]
MLTSSAVTHFGTKARIAAIVGVDPSAVSQWKELVPERCAQRLAEASNGVLVYDKIIYDIHKEKRRGKQNTPVTQRESD